MGGVGDMEGLGMGELGVWGHGRVGDMGGLGTRGGGDTGGFGDTEGLGTWGGWGHGGFGDMEVGLTQVVRTLAAALSKWKERTLRIPSVMRVST